MVHSGIEALLERETELARLAAAVERGIVSSAAVVAIAGPPGIGKSELLATARTLSAERGMRVLTARGGELERDFSYGLVRHLFEGVLGSATPGDRRRLLSGAAGHAATLFEPAQAAPSSPAESSFALLHGLFWLTANVAAERPLLLAIDDLHWSDRPSLRFVEYLSRRLEGLPVVLAVTLRPDEPGADAVLLDAFLAGLEVTRLEPHPLSEAASAQVVRAALSRDADPEFCRSCHRASGGNPLLLRELVRTLEDERVAPTAAATGAVLQLGARALSRSVGLRLRRLGSAVAGFAQAAAVLGDGASVRHAAALAGLADDDAYGAVAALSQLDVLRPEGSVEFVHPLVRAAVYANLHAGERERPHARAAQVLADAGERAERVAAHLLLVPPCGNETTVATLQMAARSSLASGDARAATSYLRRALAEPRPRASCQMSCSSSARPRRLSKDRPRRTIWARRCG